MEAVEPKEKAPLDGEEVVEPKAAKPPDEGADASVGDLPMKLKAAVASVPGAGLENPPKPANALLGAASPSSPPTGRRLRAVLMTRPASAAWPA